MIHPIYICDTLDSDLMELLKSQKAAVLEQSNLNLLHLRQMLNIMQKHTREITYQFTQVNLNEMVYLASHSGESRHVYVSNPETGSEGLLYFHYNRVQHAMFGDYAGEDAFYEIMQMKRGMFQENDMVYGDYYSIESNLDRLLAMSALRADKQEMAKGDAPETNQMASTCCTLFSEDYSLAEYFMTHYKDADLDLIYTQSQEEVLDQLQTKTDLLIVDLDLEAVNASELFERLKEKSLNVDIILIASELSEEVSFILSYPHVTRFFLKPHQYEEIGNLVSNNYLSQQFEGKLLNLSLFNVIQTFAHFRQSRLLEVTDFFSGKTGQLFISNGTLQHARFGDTIGRDALKSMMQVTYGVFRQETYWQPLESSLSVPLPRLMIYLTRFLEKELEDEMLPREMLLQNGNMITLQADKIAYLLAIQNKR